MLKVKSILLTILSFFIPFITFAQDTAEALELTIDQKIDAAFRPIADVVGSIVFFSVNIGKSSVPIVLFILIGGALFFTFYKVKVA